MNTVYIDYNLVVIMARRTRENAERLREHVFQLVDNNYRVALSAWHAVELAQSDDPDHIHSCTELVDRFQPLWLSNPAYVKCEELKGFLGSEWEDTNLKPHPNPAFNTTISQMWATYSSEAFVGETFAGTVNALHKNPSARKPIDDAVRQTPQAILIGREAMRDGRAIKYKPIVDREYFKSLLPPRAGVGAIDYLVDNVERVLEACPAVAIEDYLTRIRASESFTPKESDAADLQHAVVAVAYCDHFVSDDKKLVEHCRRSAEQASVGCKVGRNLLDIPIH